MKNLLILTVVLMLTTSAAGCRCCRWPWRGAPYGPSVPAATYSNPCPPYNPCDPCATPQMVSPGPETYAPTSP